VRAEGTAAGRAAAAAEERVRAGTRAKEAKDAAAAQLAASHTQHREEVRALEGKHARAVEELAGRVREAGEAKASALQRLAEALDGQERLRVEVEKLQGEVAVLEARAAAADGDREALVLRQVVLACVWGGCGVT
jgi:hypothetical protein